VNLNEAIVWIVEKGLKLLVGVVILLFLYRGSRPAIHRLVPSLLHVQAAALAGETTSSDEAGKRAVTLEDLLNALARVLFLISLVVLVLGVFDLWTLLAGLALVIAAILVASQDVVLDYVMGVLILVEGPYFKGDWIVVQDQRGAMQGEVQEIGLRRTVLRDNVGNVFAVSNGLIRASSNMTRVFSVAVVEVQVLRSGDLDRAIALVSRIGREIQADPQWSDSILAEAPATSVTALTVDGASIRLQLHVSPTARMGVSSEVRRRIATAFTADSIGIARWDTPLPVVTQSAAQGDETRAAPVSDA
jgi:small-conductance mechanosensitive channel